MRRKSARATIPAVAGRHLRMVSVEVGVVEVFVDDDEAVAENAEED
jgi:hypothetical protein